MIIMKIDPNLANTRVRRRSRRDRCRTATSVLLAVAVLGGVAAVGDDGAAGTNDDQTIEKILDRIEARGRDIKDIRCKVEYIVEDNITDDIIKQRGEIRFKQGNPNPTFLLVFDKLIEDGMVKRVKRWYLFDGRYLVEAIERTKSIIRHDVAPPGEEFDLFSLDQSPFPVPFGQKKAEILKHFDVTLDPLRDEEGRDHLICVPKKESHFAKDYSRMDFFVSSVVDLPTKIVMVSNPPAFPDKIMTANFSDLSPGSINRGLSDESIRLPKETAKYTQTRE
jgi:hypothetical protein